MVQAVDIAMKQSLYGYRGDQKSPFVKVTLGDPKDVPKARSKVETGFSIPGFERICRAETTYESNLAYLLRFMIDRKVNNNDNTFLINECVINICIDKYI